jgi:N-acyl-D-amino-acid deacylase
MVEEARKQGYDVTIDQYPYTASSTNLAVRLPDWALEGGLDSLRVKMKDPSMRKKILDGMKASQKKDKQKDYSFAVVAWYGPDTTMNGKSITQINIDKGRKKNFINEANLILDMLAKANAQMIYHTMNEKDLVYFMKYPFNMPAADAGISDGTGMPHRKICKRTKSDWVGRSNTKNDLFACNKIQFKRQGLDHGRKICRLADF